MRLKQEKEEVRSKPVKILITGDLNYNNSGLFIKTMNLIFRELLVLLKHIATYGLLYGALLLANAYAILRDVKYTVFNTGMFKSSNNGRSYWISLLIGVKWADIIVIFSSVTTPKLKNIISSAKRKDKQIIIRK